MIERGFHDGLTFHRVVPVLFEISEIVDQVNGARCEAEQDKTCQRQEKRLGMKELLIKNEGSKDDQVLDPLLRTHSV